MPKDLIMGFYTFSWSVLFPGKTGSAFKLPVWPWGWNTLSIVKGSIQQQVTWAPFYHWPIPASHQPIYSRCLWGSAMELGLYAMQGKNKVQFPLSIPFVFPTCPEQLWQCLFLYKWDSCSVQTGLCIAASCRCIWMGRICPGLIYLLYLIQIRQSSQSLKDSGAVRGSESRFCYAMLCNTMSTWCPEKAALEQGGKGCSLLGCRELCCGKRHEHGGEHRPLFPQTRWISKHIHVLTSNCTLLPWVLPWQTIPCDLWGSLRVDREGWASALPWMGGHTYQCDWQWFSLPFILAEEWHLLLLG